MIKDLVANYLRVTSCLEIEKANSGHTGICLGASPIFEAIYNKAFFINDKPDFISRDRVVFSAGHSSALIYATLNLYGFDISIDDLKNFRRLNSITSGHPEVKLTPGIDMSTGPLGQGIANAVGLAIAEEYLRNLFKKDNFSPVDNYTYCFCGDGCLMEGVAQEAISLAGNLALNKLILIYDKNDITIEGNINLTNNEDTKTKFASCNWNVLQVEDGNNVDEIENAIDQAKISTKPTIIIVKTHIGFGSDLQDSNKIHGKPLSKEQIQTLRKNLNYFIEDYEKPIEVKAFIEKILEENKLKEVNYFSKLKEYKQKYPKEFNNFIKLCQNFNFDFSKYKNKEILPNFDGREELHKVLNLAGSNMINLIGGSADVAPSTKVFFDNEKYFNKENRLNRNLAFGIREHGMGAICNGISLYGPLRAFCSTFFAFENYMTPAIRMSALINNPVLYLFTHDSFTVGEDGPTHQSVEQLATLRCMPNLSVFRPAGRNELLAGFSTYFSNSSPLAILIPRQVTDFVMDNFSDALKGGYVIKEQNKYDATLIATGSEVSSAIKVSDLLKEKGVHLRVVSMPCVEVFEKQTDKYKKTVIDKSKPVFCFEASGDNTWYKFATNEKTIFNITSFGKSGSASELIEYFNFRPQDISKKILNYLKSKH